jgi:hypothetical protein
MPDPKEDLRSTQESIKRDADRLQSLEARKTALDPEDEQVEELSGQAERVASSLRTKSVAERELAEQVRESD